MADKIFVDMKNLKYYQENNPKFPNEKPLIGFCPDWRKFKNKDGINDYFYMEVLLSMYKKCIEKAGGLLYIIPFDEKAENLNNIIDGYLIPGGRDVDPKYYNEERVNDIHEEAEERYNHLKDIISNLNPNIPILGVCWGFQVINVIFGGKLEMDIKDSKYHYKKRKFNVTKGTILHSIVGDTVIGNCYHHQGIKSIGKGLIVNSLDDYHQQVHGLESRENGRWILSILWHPESSYISEKGNLLITENQLIYNGFLKEVIKRKLNK